MRNFPGIGILMPEILLPRTGIDLSKWSVIACDQYTSQPEYWEQVKTIIGEAPSTYNLILPEVFLGKPEEETQIKLTHQKMSEYIQHEIFSTYEGFVLVERCVSGKTRHGLVLALDLEEYNFFKGSQSLIRATEGTILQRLPPRIRIREGAPLEIPHILVLIDDPEKTVIEPLVKNVGRYNTLYDFELMLGSGHLKGFSVNDEKSIRQLTHALERLANPDTFYSKYNVPRENGVLLFAMGDGNHSLATAKSIWEKVKHAVGMDHPARYALVEIENVHDDGLEFEPIHRVVFNIREDFHKAMADYFGEEFYFESVANEQNLIDLVRNQHGPDHAIGIVSHEGCGIVHVKNPKSNLPVGTIQQFLDGWISRSKAEEIDYVHGFEATFELGKHEGNLGIYLPAMNKSELFKTVILDGALPRKTFSMGEAHEKRFYMECRKIV